MTVLPPRRILLVGFMGSGKSTVGPLLAERVGWAFADMDENVVAREGRTIPRIFRESGEAAFRSLEARVATDLLALERVVVATGGGWAAESGRLGALPDGTVVVWLRVSAERAVARLGEAGGERPLLAVSDPAAAARDLLREREPRYALAHVEVDTDGRTPEDVSAHIAAVLRGPPWNLTREQA